MMYAEARNIQVFWMKQKCCYHCGVTHGKEHSHYCSLADGLRDRGEHQVYLPVKVSSHLRLPVLEGNAQPRTPDFS